MAFVSIFRGKHLEPPPWLYSLIARGLVARRIHRRFAADLTAALPHGARLLDVGTGPAYLLGLLAKERADLHLFGVDFDRRMIHLARKGRRSGVFDQVPVDFVVGDALALPFSRGTFDQIIATFSLHIWPRPGAGLEEMVRVLRPGGGAWIYEMNRQASMGDIEAFSREEGFPFPLVYPAFRTLSLHHALRAEDFTAYLEQTPEAAWRLHPAHHIFWRAELSIQRV